MMTGTMTAMIGTMTAMTSSANQAQNTQGAKSSQGTQGHQGKSPQRVTSARRRIAGWILGTVAIVLIALVLTTRTLLLTGVEKMANEAVSQEISEFNTFLDQGIDPNTAEPFTSSARLFQVYLSRQIPGNDEAFVAVVGGKAMQINRDFSLPGSESATRVPGASGATNWLSNQTVQEIVDSEVNSGIYETPQGDEVHWGRVDIRSAAGSSAPADYFIVGFNATPSIAWVNNEVRSIAFVGLGGLVLTWLIAWLIAGQILAPTKRIRHVATRISETNLSARVPETGTDDNRELARAFNEMLDRIEALHLKQAKFVDDASHELKTPITVIRGQLDLFERSNPDQQRRSIATMTTELDRMTRLVDDVLTLATAEAADFVRLQDQDMAQFLIDLEDKISVMGDRDFQLVQVAEVHAAIDEQRITEAMLELANNAIRHTKPGGRIEFGSTIRQDQNDDSPRLDLWVRDYGPGIPAEHLESIFERFAQPVRGIGAGLGLSIVKAIMDAHRGTAWVESVEGKGSTFGISLAVNDVDKHLAGDTREVSAKDNPATKRFKRLEP